MVTDVVKEMMAFKSRLQVYHEVPGSYRDQSGLKAIGTRWIYRTKVTLQSISPSPVGCTRNQESERVDTRRREQHVCGHAPQVDA